MNNIRWTGLLALAAVAASSAAADYLVRPIRMLAGFTGGGGSDLAARTVAIKMSAAFGWYGVVAPKATPAALVQRLSTAIARGLQAPEVKERLAADG